MVSTSTKFAPAERSNQDQLLQQRNLLISSIPFLDTLISVSNIAVILNKNRQILYSNKSLLSSLNIEDENLITGKRPGEALCCNYSSDEANGCGTSEHCSVCGAVIAILESQKSLSSVTKECRISTINSNIELSVTASSMIISDELFTVFSAIDISDAKRKIALDRIFFHDVINTTGAIKGLAQITLDKTDDENIIDILSIILDASENIMEVIESQRDLTLAENNELQVHHSEINVLDIIKNVVTLYQSHDTANNKTITILEPIPISTFESDPVLVKRILSNLIKNALEAAEINMNVSIGCSLDHEHIEFYIHNETLMSKQVELQIFQRTFSTKGVNRGLGTYSVKLLTERYLNGSVSFETSKENGTTFRVRLPLVASQNSKLSDS